jgi:ribosomal-protein-serine acetyltransferase
MKFKSYFVISDELSLNMLTPADASNLFLLIDSNRAYLRQWLPWLNIVSSPSNSLYFIEECTADINTNRSLTLGIFLNAMLIGIISTHSIDWQNKKTTLGYWLASSFQGNGFTTIACEILIEYLFNEIELNRVGIHCSTLNQKSIAIPKRLNFKKEGILREAEWLYDHYEDHVVYSLLHSEIKQKLI